MAPSLGSLFTTYVRMRQQGPSMEDVVNRLQDAAQQLSRDERHRLGDLVMEWEEKYGRNPKTAPVPIEATPKPSPQIPSPPPSTPIVTPMAQPAPSRSAAFGTKFLDPSKLAVLDRKHQAPAVSSCPHCGSPNPPGYNACRNCKQLLSSKPAAPTRRLDDTLPKRPAMLANYFTPESAMLIRIKGAKGVLEGFPRTKMIVGRGASPVQGQPFLDLAPFDGENLGVSRYHAEIRYINNTLVMTDLDSDNGTFINEVRLYPYEIRVLHSNDDLRFGKLEMKVYFKIIQAK